MSEILVLDEGLAAGEATAGSGVSWAAVFAGGVTAAAISATLLLLGTGLGLSAISPWPGGGMSAAGFTALAAVWLVVVQWVAALFGGYMAGRLRTKWTGLHNDELFFRDTAHGFLAWALGTLIIAGIVTMAGASGAKTGAEAGAMALSHQSETGYYVDELFRVNANPAAGAAEPALGVAQQAGPTEHDARAQAGTILAHSAVAGSVSAADNDYLAQLVAAQTGLAPADAELRVQDVVGQERAAIGKARQEADAGRQAAAELAIWSFVSLLIGAFIASVAGAVGGRLRDHY